MSKSKAQGTRFETDIVRLAQLGGFQAWRLAEGGGGDPGDVVIVTPSGDHYVVECKHRENLPVHGALEKARLKAAKADLPFAVTDVALIWKRTLPAPDGGRRKPHGTVVVIDLSDWLRLIGGN
jgi:hypothetical protein